MPTFPPLNSEEDVRTKIVLPWLIQQGFDLKNIHVEHSFRIKVGRGVYKIENSSSAEETFDNQKDTSCSSLRPRADILVRNNEGKNLLIIEVKDINQPLDDKARDQAISYARLLLDGNIAPFAVLTNGVETKIFDSISKQQIDGTKVTNDILKTDFHIDVEDLRLRSEALQTFISLSPNNLVSFCKSQVDFRMKLLKGNNLDSGKKYIPSLYIERVEEKQRLENLLDKQKKRVAVLTGSPQVGKTNFVCHTVDERITRGLPCLFYPAIGLKQSLITEIAEDFEWILSESGNSNYIIISKLKRILQSLGQKLVIFIDGWNEANIELARTLDSESERLSSNEIQIVISFTNVSANRLLGGYGGNPSRIAEAASISSDDAQQIEIASDKVKPTWSLINIKKYSEREKDEAYKLYSKAFNVTVLNSHQRTHDPYVLGAAMRLYQNQTLPDHLDEPNLLERILNQKYRRGINLCNFNLHICLRELAKEMFNNGSPVAVDTLSIIWNLPISQNIPSGFFESALLAQVTNENNLPSIDFYYGKERDYVICYWANNWYQKLENNIDISAELAQAINTNAGIEALRWFFKQSKHIDLILRNYGSLPVYREALIRQILISSLRELASSYDQDTQKWLEYALDRTINDQEKLVKIEAVKLTSLLTKDKDNRQWVLQNDSTWSDIVNAVLSMIDNESTNAVEEVALEGLREIHWEIGDQESDESDITDVLKTLLDSPLVNIRSASAEAFGYIAPTAFLRCLSEKIVTKKLFDNHSLDEYETGVSNADNGLHEIYYGSMCPGALYGLQDNPEGLEEEYMEMKPIIEPVVNAYYSKDIVQSLANILSDLKPIIEDDNSEPFQGRKWSQPFKDLYTLPLPFDSEDETN